MSNEEKDERCFKWYMDEVPNCLWRISESVVYSTICYIQSESDARRIVASVNALAKLPIEDIERLKPEDVRHAMELRELTKPASVRMVPITEKAD